MARHEEFQLRSHSTGFIAVVRAERGDRVSAMMRSFARYVGSITYWKFRLSNGMMERGVGNPSVGMQHGLCAWDAPYFSRVEEVEQWAAELNLDGDIQGRRTGPRISLHRSRGLAWLLKNVDWDPKFSVYPEDSENSNGVGGSSAAPKLHPVCTFEPMGPREPSPIGGDGLRDFVLPNGSPVKTPLPKSVVHMGRSAQDPLLLEFQHHLCQRRGTLDIIEQILAILSVESPGDHLWLACGCGSKISQGFRAICGSIILGGTPATSQHTYIAPASVGFPGTNTLQILESPLTLMLSSAVPGAYHKR
ncbi:hypothetical protein DFH09DRAFT_1097719 [Mycena vulgaris]|nr:hypothetical protein DFH09DRAFT_1097719 [Mycena vulgaris]